MADPLSITASVAGIISLAGAVFTQIYKYANAAGSAQKDVRDLAEEVKTIRDLLRALSALAAKLDATTITTTFNLSYVESCQETLQRIEDGLSKARADFEKSKVRIVQRKLKWPFTAAETRGLLNNLARQKGNIGLSLGTDCVSLLLSELTRLNQLETAVTQISNGLQNMSAGVQNVLNNARLIDPYFKRVVTGFFMEVDVQARHDMNLVRVLTDTHRRTCGMPVFRNWLNKPGLALAITGLAGIGKSVLASCLVREALCHRTFESGVAYFYCDFRDARTQSPTKVLGALASQLADQSNEAYECLERYYKCLHPLEPNAAAKPPTIPHLVSVLQEITGCFERVSIIIDGLDGCGGECGAVGDVLISAGSARNNSMTLLGRNKNRISTQFRETGLGAFSMHNLPDDPVVSEVWDDLIGTYADYPMEARMHSYRWHVDNPQIYQKIVDTLNSRADGEGFDG
ncbi:hypothetical protein ACRE_002370 [Hapsidospora chrysogenum ATCC 11550]|uniref:Fungal N-terminal domain-containing protein n=1 Tax=Hapsidospora chrysogenum (strain ATCC 11550 / CBS 779.69 / DSM 880 / IAM 14645 / JCM 23072 / IMI 49137) TaxID=857340 RepID=A0A086TI25_HAPC1|nr:hypothetical protein ACRE_002370 [Hapsidospora chrysogenum ATCC 11550]